MHSGKVSTTFLGACLLSLSIATAAQAQAPGTSASLLKPPERPRVEAGADDVAPSQLTAQGTANLVALARLYGVLRFFHPSGPAVVNNWDRWLPGAIAAVEPAANTSDLAQRLKPIVAGVAPTVAIVPTQSAGRASALPPPPSGDSHAVRWRHVGFSDAQDTGYQSERVRQPAIAQSDLERIDLGNGLTAVVPLAAWRDGPVWPDNSALFAFLKPPAFVPSGFDRTTRLAGVIESWAVVRHFYPYFDVVPVDWDAQLAPTLSSAATDSDDLEFADTLRRMLAALDDGHARVIYAQAKDGVLPLAWDVIEDQLVVTAVGEGASDSGLEPGDIVLAIGGVPAQQAIAANAALASGSKQAETFVALRELLGGTRGEEATLWVRTPAGEREVQVTYGSEMAPTHDVGRPEPLKEMAPGIFYLDVTRASDEEIAAAHPKLAAANGIVVDMRGYPRAMPKFLDHMTDRPVRSARMDRPVFLRPGGTPETYTTAEWNVFPRRPQWSRNIAVLVDMPAVSYSESILSVVAGNNLATLVGEPSGGANGNIAIVTLPGEYRIVFTGMRVQNRDGSQHHLVGIRPDVPVSPTIEGIRAGRDEMIERALEIVRARS